MIIKFITNQLRINRQFIKFALVGVSNLALSLVTYYGLIYFHINYQIANIAGFVIGSLNGYLWNKRWVFKTKQSVLKGLLKFYTTYLSTWALGAVLLFVEVEVLGFSEWVAPLFNVVITTPINYMLNKYWTFKK